ncbi:MAG: CPBP family intramembrane metalloprotease [Clostridiales bacterium]|nr:CPBP family intramembrane metalloprotease [Clostridiales bacterium]
MNITKKRLLIYLGLSFGMAWLIFFIFIFTGHTWTGSTSEMMSLVSLGMLTPAVAHVITRKITKEGFRLAGKDSMMLGIDLKGKKWVFFLLAMFLPVVYATLGDGILWMIRPDAFGKADVSMFTVIMYPLLSVVSGTVLSFAAFGEEFGWRGYMMPKLIELMGMPKALIIGGIIWGLWHAPLTCVGHNFGMDYPGFPYVGILLMCLYCTALGVILTFITIKTNSVWPAAFMHGVNNSMPSMLVLFMKDADYPLYVYALSLTPIVLIGVLLFIVLIKGKK